MYTLYAKNWSISELLIVRSADFEAATLIWSKSDFYNSTQSIYQRLRDGGLPALHSVIGTVCIGTDFISFLQMRSCVYLLLTTVLGLSCDIAELLVPVREDGVLPNSGGSIDGDEIRNRIWSQYLLLREKARKVETSFGILFLHVHIYNLFNSAYLLYNFVHHPEKSISFFILVWWNLVTLWIYIYCIKISLKV